MPLETRAIDFVGYDRRGQIVLLVEAKSRPGTTEAWASQLRGNILEHDLLPEAQYFVIATPDRIYVWKDGQSRRDQRLPDLILNGSEALGRYFEAFGQPPSQINPESFEFIVLAWLDDLSNPSLQPKVGEPALSALSKIGFLDAVKDARIEHQA